MLGFPFSFPLTKGLNYLQTLYMCDQSSHSVSQSLGITDAIAFKKSFKLQGEEQFGISHVSRALAP